MQQKTAQESCISALIMLTAKAAEGCTPCLDGYKRLAVEAGASQRDIDFAMSAGNRVHKKVLAEPSSTPSLNEIKAVESGAQLEVVTGKESEDFFEEVMLDEKVKILDDYFRSQGYQPMEAARGMARMQYADRTCTQAYLPYQLDDKHFTWIDYHLGKAGVDLVGISVDLTKEDVLATGQLPHESVIVQEGQVVPGHACDMSFFWNCLVLGCVGASGCLAMGPFWWACASLVCGGYAGACCLLAGCC